MDDDLQEHQFVGSSYKPPLLEKPVMIQGKKALLQYPGESLQQRKKPLLGVTPNQSLMTTPWLGSKRQFPSQDLNVPTSSPYPSNASNKRQALLPTPGGEWAQRQDKTEKEPNPLVQTGLLPRPYRNSAQVGLLPDPSCSSPHNMYSTPRAPSPLQPMENGKQPFLSAAHVTATPVSSSPGLLPLPGSRINDPMRSVDARSSTFKKAPLLQTPSEQGVVFSNKKTLLPMVPMMVTVQEQTGKPALLKAPPLSINRVNHKREKTVGTGQGLLREPLIFNPPGLQSILPESPVHYHKFFFPTPHYQTLTNSSCVKRPLLPTPSLMF